MGNFDLEGTKMTSLFRIKALFWNHHSRMKLLILERCRSRTKPFVPERWRHHSKTVSFQFFIFCLIFFVFTWLIAYNYLICSRVMFIYIIVNLFYIVELCDDEIEVSCMLPYEKARYIRHNLYLTTFASMLTVLQGIGRKRGWV